MSDPSVIVAGARTPFGRFLGGLTGFSAVDLGAIAIRGALDRSAVAPDLVDYLIMGQVLQAGAGQNPARTAGLAAGLPGSVPSVTINKVCLSGLTAIAQADQLIRAGEATVVVAGGMESMSQAPHLLKGSRRGFGYGDAALVDALAFDALRDQATGLSMGALTEAWYASRPQLSRAEQDAYAARSHQRATRAQDLGVYDAEIVPVTVPQRRCPARIIAADEGVRRDTTGLGSLAPAFAPDGTITAGSASPLSDGAAAVIVVAKARAQELGLSWLAEIGAYGTVAGPDSSFVLQPAAAATRALAREDLAATQLDVVEISEAFAAVALESSRALGIAEERVNVNGGAIALGHPLGASGARMTLHLALELGRRGGGAGVASLCGGGGQGDALVLRVPAAVDRGEFTVA